MVGIRDVWELKIRRRARSIMLSEGRVEKGVISVHGGWIVLIWHHFPVVLVWEIL